MNDLFCFLFPCQCNDFFFICELFFNQKTFLSSYRVIKVNTVIMNKENQQFKCNFSDAVFKNDRANTNMYLLVRKEEKKWRVVFVKAVKKSLQGKMYCCVVGKKKKRKKIFVQYLNICSNICSTGNPLNTKQACQWMTCDRTCIQPHMPVFI